MTLLTSNSTTSTTFSEHVDTRAQCTILRTNCTSRSIIVYHRNTYWKLPYSENCSTYSFSIFYISTYCVCKLQGNVYWTRHIVEQYKIAKTIKRNDWKFIYFTNGTKCYSINQLPSRVKIYTEIKLAVLSRIVKFTVLNFSKFFYQFWLQAIIERFLEILQLVELKFSKFAI